MQNNNLPIFNVKVYGAKGDNSTDDVTALQAAATACAAVGGILYFPKGLYKSSGVINITAAMKILGAGSTGAGQLTSNDILLRGQYDNTRVISTSTTANLFDIQAAGVIFEDIGLYCNQANPTAGAAIKVESVGIMLKCTRVNINGFYDCIFNTASAQANISDCSFYNFVRYGYYNSTVTLPDAGDSSLINCWFNAGAYDCTAAVREESGGGLRITSCKFNANGQDVGRIVDCISVNIASAPNATSDLPIIGCSFENFTGVAIKGVFAGGTYANIVITGNQISPYTSTATAINISTSGAGALRWVNIGDNIFTTGVTNVNTAITLNGAGGAIDKVTFGYNTIYDWGANYSITNCTNVKYPLSGINGESTNFQFDNSISNLKVSNSVAGAAKQAYFSASANTAHGQFGALSSTFTTYGRLVANAVYLYGDNTAGISIFNDAAGPITFSLGAGAPAAEVGRFSTNGRFLVGTTTDNAGFIQTAASTATVASMYLNGSAVNVTSPTDGMLWYNSTTHTLNFRDSGVTTNLLAGGGASVAGSNTQVQYNNSGAFGASSNFTWDNSISNLKIINATAGTAKQAFYSAANDLGNFFQMGVPSSTYTSYGRLVPNVAYMYGNTIAGIAIMVDANGPFTVSTGTGAPAVERFRIGGDGAAKFNAYTTATSFTGTALANLQTDSSGNVIQGPAVSAAAYTPTLTNTTNLASSSLASASYIRVGNIVYIQAGGSYTASAGNTMCALTISLPFTSSTGTFSAVGVVTIDNNSTTPFGAGEVTIVSTTTARLFFTPTTTSAGSWQAVLQISL